MNNDASPCLCPSRRCGVETEEGARWFSEKKKKKEKPRLVATDDNWCLLGHSGFRPDLSHRLYPDPFSNASNEYVARCARS